MKSFKSVRVRVPENAMVVGRSEPQRVRLTEEIGNDRRCRPRHIRHEHGIVSVKLVVVADNFVDSVEIH